MKTNLQKMRKAAGFKSAKSFAEHIGMNVNTYTDYEQGKRMFTLDKAWEFADILDCTLDELAGRTPPVNSEDSLFLRQFHALPIKGRQAVLEQIEFQMLKSLPRVSDRPVSGVAPAMGA